MRQDPEHAAFEAWVDQNPIGYPGIEYAAFVAGYRAAQQPQDIEPEAWMSCDVRSPWVTNAMEYRIKVLRDMGKYHREEHKGEYLARPKHYFADACAEAAKVFEARLKVIFRARGLEEQPEEEEEEA